MNYFDIVGIPVGRRVDQFLNVRVDLLVFVLLESALVQELINQLLDCIVVNVI